MSVDISKVPVMEFRAHCWICGREYHGTEDRARVWADVHLCIPEDGSND